LFVTNHHVVKNAGVDIRLVLNAGTAEQKVFTARVLRSDEREDLALLKVNDRAELPILELGATAGLTELQPMIAFGFPFGKQLAGTEKEYASITVSSLSISSLRKKAGALYRIQLDGSLNPGNSGGPVLDRTGRVVGVVVSGIRGSGLAEAIPVSAIRTFLVTPTVSISYPTLGLKDQGKPARFEARVASIVSGDKVEVDLIVQAGPHKVKAPMIGKGETFSAEVIALPAAVRKNVYVGTVYVDEATLPIQLAPRKFQVGGKTIDLGAVSQISLAGAGEVVLSDGTLLPGPIRDLGSVTITIAGQNLTIELAKATKVVLASPELPGPVLCTVIVRADGQEVARHEHAIRVEGATTATRPTPGLAVSPAAPPLTGDRIEVALPSGTDLFCVGGNGRYIILRLPRERKLAVFDASAAKVVKYLPLAEDNALIAAGLNKLFVVLPNANAIQRWDLGTFTKELTAPLIPKEGAIRHVLLGSAAHGPLLVIWGSNFAVTSYFLDTVRLKPLEFRNAQDERRSLAMPIDHLSRVSADGTTFTWWGSGSPSGFNVLTLLNDTATAAYTHTSYGHLAPSPDGKVIYTGRGAFTPQGVGLNGAGNNRGDDVNYLVPALQGRYYLRVPFASFSNRGKTKESMTLHIEGDVRPLVTLKDVEVPGEVNPWGRDKIGADQRILLIPSAKLLVVLPTTNDRLVLHKLDIEAALEASGIDYLLVTSIPVSSARRRVTYAYDLAVKSKKGGVQYKLESAPEGMKVDTRGRLTWDVPADYNGKTAEVLLTIADSSGQEIFHSFKVAVMK